MLIPDQPFNLKLLEMDEFIKQNRVGQVTSHAIFEASGGGTLFEKTGLFSEEIFGQIGTPERLVTFGYIELNTAVLNPLVYKNLVTLNALYEEIIEGRSYAIWDENINNFVKSTNHDLNAKTGFTFFMEHFLDINFKYSESHQRADKIDIIKKYGSSCFIRRMIVLPAGLRDIRTTDSRLTQDDINKLYLSLLSYTFALPPNAINLIYDSIKVSIQKKIVEVYEYIDNIVTGKRGYIQNKYGKRRVALGTRNVITSTTYSTLTPNDLQYLDSDTTKIGLYQSMKGLQPLSIHYIRSIFLDPRFKTESNTIALTNPDTLLLEYKEISNKELSRFNTNQAIEVLINRFANADVRHLPITIKDINNNNYYLYMVYDTGDTISLFRSIKDLEVQLGHPPNKKYIHPLTWIEMFYMSVYRAASNRHVFITRYPVIQDDSCYPSRIHLATTSPGRIVKAISLLSDDVVQIYPEYPVLESRSYLDSMALHLSKLQGIGGDREFKPYLQG
jgi:hypothetical protein